MTFKIGDQVIHPRHGLGLVTKLAIKQFIEGKNRPFYEIAFPGSTLWVPLSVSTSGVRKLTGKSEINKCRKILTAPPNSLNPDFRLRQLELKDHIKEGTLMARCEVVRDLKAYSWKKQLSGSIVAFLQSTLDVLSQEWAAVEGIALTEANTEIQSLLEKGKEAHDNK